MTEFPLELLRSGGLVDELTASLRSQYGVRALSVWQDSVRRFAAGRSITVGIQEEHDRQSPRHWALARAAALAQVERASNERAVTQRSLDREQPKAAVTTDLRRKLGWGRR